MRTTFATGFNGVWGLAFSTNGYLFEADALSGHIYKISTSGSKTTFASGLSNPEGLAINTAGLLFEADLGSGKIFKYTAAGAPMRVVNWK